MSQWSSAKAKRIIDCLERAIKEAKGRVAWLSHEA